MESTDRPNVCHWREHPLARSTCGHVYCRVCAPQAFAEGFTCDYCEDAADAADELLDVHELAHC